MHDTIGRHQGNVFARFAIGYAFESGRNDPRYAITIDIRPARPLRL